jgi:hypothetical protein
LIIWGAKFGARAPQIVTAATKELGLSVQLGLKSNKPT